MSSTRVMPFLKVVASLLVSLALILAVVIVVSSDDENPRDAIVGTLIFFMIAGVSYGYCTGFRLGESPGRVGAEQEATDGQSRLRLREEERKRLSH